MTMAELTVLAQGDLANRIIMALTVFVLATFVGLEVIAQIPTMLHTPLMSGTNAIHGIVILGALFIAFQGGPIGVMIGTAAIVAGTLNVIGGFVVTDRMLRMFKRKK
jgi:NAD(P) transhydrogenase subunit alpha